MSEVKVQSWEDFKAGVLSTAQGEPAPEWAGGLSVESPETLLRLLTPQNRELLRIIRDERPASVAALARRTKRAEPNLARTLGKLEALGLVTIRKENSRRVPTTNAGPLRLEIDPFGMNDRLHFA